MPKTGPTHQGSRIRTGLLDDVLLTRLSCRIVGACNVYTCVSLKQNKKYRDRSRSDNGEYVCTCMLVLYTFISDM